MAGQSDPKIDFPTAGEARLATKQVYLSMTLQAIRGQIQVAISEGKSRISYRIKCGSPIIPDVDAVVAFLESKKYSVAKLIQHLDFELQISW